MGWPTSAAIAEVRSKVRVLTAEQLEALTWEEAAKYVLHDTLALARWQGLKKSGLTPGQAILRSHFLEWPVLEKPTDAE